MPPKRKRPIKAAENDLGPVQASPSFSPDFFAALPALVKSEIFRFCHPKDVLFLSKTLFETYFKKGSANSNVIWKAWTQRDCEPYFPGFIFIPSDLQIQFENVGAHVPKEFYAKLVSVSVQIRSIADVDMYNEASFKTLDIELTELAKMIPPRYRNIYPFLIHYFWNLQYHYFHAEMACIERNNSTQNTPPVCWKSVYENRFILQGKLIGVWMLLRPRPESINDRAIEWVNLMSQVRHLRLAAEYVNRGIMVITQGENSLINHCMLFISKLKDIHQLILIIDALIPKLTLKLAITLLLDTPSSLTASLRDALLNVIHDRIQTLTHTSLNQIFLDILLSINLKAKNRRDLLKAVYDLFPDHAFFTTKKQPLLMQFISQTKTNSAQDFSDDYFTHLMQFSRIKFGKDSCYEGQYLLDAADKVSSPRKVKFAYQLMNLRGVSDAWSNRTRPFIHWILYYLLNYSLPDCHDEFLLSLPSEVYFQENEAGQTGVDVCVETILSESDYYFEGYSPKFITHILTVCLNPAILIELAITQELRAFECNQHQISLNRHNPKRLDLQMVIAALQKIEDKEALAEMLYHVLQKLLGQDLMSAIVASSKSDDVNVGLANLINCLLPGAYRIDFIFALQFSLNITAHFWLCCALKTGLSLHETCELGLRCGDWNTLFYFVKNAIEENGANYFVESDHVTRYIMQFLSGPCRFENKKWIHSIFSSFEWLNRTQYLWVSLNQMCELLTLRDQCGNTPFYYSVYSMTYQQLKKAIKIFFNFQNSAGNTPHYMLSNEHALSALDVIYLRFSNDRAKSLIRMLTFGETPLPDSHELPVITTSPLFDGLIETLFRLSEGSIINRLSQCHDRVFYFLSEKFECKTLLEIAQMHNLHQVVMYINARLNLTKYTPNFFQPQLTAQTLPSIQTDMDEVDSFFQLPDEKNFWGLDMDLN